MVIEVLMPLFAVCKLHQPVMPGGSFVSLTVGGGEISLVCEQACVPPDCTAEMGWRALRVQGPLEFSLTGVLAELSGALASTNVSIFALSTYDTDYLLVKQEKLEQAVDALALQGHSIVSAPAEDDAAS